MSHKETHPTDGHLLPVLLPRRLNIAFEPVRLELEDGYFLDLDWTRIGGDKLAILSHGLEGCSGDACNRGMATSPMRPDGTRSRGPLLVGHTGKQL